MLRSEYFLNISLRTLTFQILFSHSPLFRKVELLQLKLYLCLKVTLKIKYINFQMFLSVISDFSDLSSLGLILEFQMPELF